MGRSEILLLVILCAAVVGVIVRALRSASRAGDFVPPVTAPPHGPDLASCYACGKMFPSTVAVCPHCWYPRQPASVKPRKSRGRAIFLAILFGGIGLHKFYLDRRGQGIVYVLLCWTLIPAVIGVAEGLAWAISSEESFHAKYG